MATIFRTASLWLKITTLAMAIGLLLFIIGFATVSWIGSEVYTKRRNGLWKVVNIYGQTSDYGSTNDFHQAIQAMETLGFIGYAVAFIVILLYMTLDSCRRRDFLKGATAVTFAGIVFAIIGFILFTSDNEKNYGSHGVVQWSMGLACAGTALYGLAGIMLIIQLIK